VRLLAFNAQNMGLRMEGGAPVLSGARDDDVAEDRGPAAEALDGPDRRLTALTIREAAADLVLLLEVLGQDALDRFADLFLARAAGSDFPHRAFHGGNDGRGLGFGVLARRPPERLVGHAEVTPRDLGLVPPANIDPAARIFRRDCLEIGLGALTLFLVHFKAPYPDPEAAWAVRRLEAEAVRALIARRFSRPEAALWLILGDFNEPGADFGGDASAVAPLTGGFAVDLCERLPEGERWTYFHKPSNRYSRPDGLLASPALAARWPEARPQILRLGMGREVERHRGPRLLGVGQHRPHASDHAAVVLDLPGL
jgi:hypothetical protein